MLMKQNLAVKYLSALITILALNMGAIAYAQEADLPPPAPAPKDLPPKDLSKVNPPKPDLKNQEKITIVPLHKPEASLLARKDLTVRSEIDREKMLDRLFIELKNSPSEEDAKITAEEIWAVWLQSGSASVDLLLHRGIAAQNNGDLKLARRMYDHVLRLAPNYPEGWSRSGRLAAETDDLKRAVNDTLKALSLEPRHFYALWTLGNLLEMLGKPEQAFEVYEHAHKLYPKHKQINDRYNRLKESAKGKAL